MNLAKDTCFQFHNLSVFKVRWAVPGEPTTTLYILIFKFYVWDFFLKFIKKNIYKYKKKFKNKIYLRWFLRSTFQVFPNIKLFFYQIYKTI